MRRVIATAVALLLCCAASANAAPPPVQSAAYVVENAASGEVLAQRHAYEHLPIASITKLMTVLVALDRLRPDQVVTVRRAAAAVGESTINLRAGERLSVRDLVKGALIQSANDAADALADAAANGSGATLVRWMNERAQRMGLSGTHFVRPDGLDASVAFSTAHDMARLAQVAMHNAEIRSAVAEQYDVIAGGRRLHTWDDLLGRFPGLVGVKTGHTRAAGWCQVAAVRRTGYTLYAVVLGDPTRSVRNDDLTSLLSWGVSRYRTAPVVDESTVYAQVRPDWGRRPLDLVASKPLVRVYRIDHPLVVRALAARAVALPIRRGQAFGEVQVWDGGRLLGTRPLVATRSVTKPGFFGRVGFFAGQTAHHLWGWVS